MYDGKCSIVLSRKSKNALISNNIMPRGNGEIIIDAISGKESITFESFKNLVKDPGFKESNIHIHELLEGSNLLLPSPKVEPRNPELEARIQKLKAEFANKEYRQMTENLGHHNTGINQLRTDVKAANAQITAIINFVLTIGGSFIFAYKAVEYSLPEPNIPAQVLMGILTSTMVALADLYFLARTI